MIEFRGNSSKLGHQSPMILALGRDTPSCLLGQHALLSELVTLSLVCRDTPIKVGGSIWEALWGGWGIKGASFPLVTPSSEGNAPHPCLEFPPRDGGEGVSSTLPYGRSPKSYLSKLPAPTPICSKCNPVGCRDGVSVSPHQLCPRKKGRPCPWGGNSCKSELWGWPSCPT